MISLTSDLGAEITSAQIIKFDLRAAGPADLDHDISLELRPPGRFGERRCTADTARQINPNARYSGLRAAVQTNKHGENWLANARNPF